MRLRSLLFAPASRPDVLAKLPRSRPDGVVLDLEDAVAPSAKADARVHAREVGAQLAAEHPGLAVYVRVNAVASTWFADDVALGVDPTITGIVVPKLDSADQVDRVHAALDQASATGLTVLAGIETVAGVEGAGRVFAAGVGAAYFGAEDYVADLGGVRTVAGTEVLYARSRVAIAARLAGIAVLDQVVTDIGDDEAFVADASTGRSLGYGGKLCIHPGQVTLANRVFSPSADEVEHARRLIEAYEQALASGTGVISFEGQMVDEPLARRARAVLDAAQ